MRLVIIHVICIWIRSFLLCKPSCEEWTLFINLSPVLMSCSVTSIVKMMHSMTPVNALTLLLIFTAALLQRTHAPKLAEAISYVASSGTSSVKMALIFAHFDPHGDTLPSSRESFNKIIPTIFEAEPFVPEFCSARWSCIQEFSLRRCFWLT